MIFGSNEQHIHVQRSLVHAHILVIMFNFAYLFEILWGAKSTGFALPLKRTEAHTSPAPDGPSFLKLKEELTSKITGLSTNIDCNPTARISIQT